MPRTVQSTVAAVAATIITLAVLAGCSATNQITTQLPYNASDGVRIAVGSEVEGLALLVVAESQDGPGALTGAVTNRSDRDVVVTVSVQGAADLELELAPGATTYLVGEDLVRIESVPAPPGSTLPVALGTLRSGAVLGTVPVLDGTLPEYAALLEP